VQGIAAPTIGNPDLRRIFTAGHKGILKPDSLQNRLEQGNRTGVNGRKSAPHPAAARQRARALRIPYVLGLGAGAIADLAARLTGRRFPVSAIRVRKYRAHTQFASARLRATGFVPRHDLRHALASTIRHEFGSPEQRTPLPRASAPGGRRAEKQAQQR
jgi:hypothetical protein